MTYFYLCSYLVDNGGIITPGNWGRFVKLYTPQAGNPWNLARELIFEAVRIERFANKPSRLEGNFVCETISEASAFKVATNRKFDLIYEVDLVDSNPVVHRGCWASCSVEQNDDYHSMLSKANKYWTGNEIQRPELLTTSALRVLRRT